MSRIAEAMKRTGTAAGAGVALHDDSAGEPMPFFVPGAPVAAPLKEARPSAAPRRPRSDRPHAPSRDRAAADWPSYQDAEKLVVSPSFTPSSGAQYNKLAAALHQAQLEHGVKVVMLTSAVPGEGKSLTAANLVLTLSESYQRRVLLVDADLRHPTVHQLFGVSNSRGLSTCLATEDPLPLVHVSPRLALLPAGEAGADPMKTLTSDRMRAFVADQRGAFDWVVLDTAPIGLLPDAKLLASMADITLLVAFAGKTPYPVIQRAADALGPERIFGIVLNRVSAPRGSYPNYENYYGSKGR